MEEAICKISRKKAPVGGAKDKCEPTSKDPPSTVKPQLSLDVQQVIDCSYSLKCSGQNVYY